VSTKYYQYLPLTQDYPGLATRTHVMPHSVHYSALTQNLLNLVKTRFLASFCIWDEFGRFLLRWLSIAYHLGVFIWLV